MDNSSKEKLLTSLMDARNEPILKAPPQVFNGINDKVAVAMDHKWKDNNEMEGQQ